MIFAQRSREFIRIKSENPEFTHKEVAETYNDWLNEQIEKGEFVYPDKSAEYHTVKNTFTKLNEPWIRGKRHNR